jgi:hypothetical protein
LFTEEVLGLLEFEDEDLALLRNIGNYIPVDTAEPLRRLESASSLDSSERHC